MTADVVIRHKGVCDYEHTWKSMVDFTVNRTPESMDEIWVLEHYPVYTQGTSCRDVPRGGYAVNGVPVSTVHSDRGGQMTYHGPGQLIIYCLLDLKRNHLGPKSLVKNVEQALINLLACYQLDAFRRQGAPGVYLKEGKIAALGFRIKKGCCYHGLSLNLDMDLSPFEGIDPCGYPNQPVSQLCDFVEIDREEVVSRLVEALVVNLDLQVVDDVADKMSLRTE